MTSKIFRLLGAAFALSMVIPGVAQAVHWNMQTTFDPGYNTYTVNSGGNAMSIDAYSTTGSNGTIENARLYGYGSSGMGVRNRFESSGAPNHAMDNNAYTDFMLFDFSAIAGKEVDLYRVLTGYNVTLNSNGNSTNDTPELSILAYDKSIGGDKSAAQIKSDLVGNTLGGLVNDGWRTYGTTVSPNTTFDTGWSSSFWIVATALPNVQGNFTSYVKVKGIKGNLVDPRIDPQPNPGVPAPATLLLMGFGLAFLRRVKRQAA